jgi:exonuclease III
MSDQNCSIFNWNVRGLNNPPQHKVVRDMVQEHRATIVALQETKLHSVDRKDILEILGPRFVENFIALPAAGTRGYHFSYG